MKIGRLLTVGGFFFGHGTQKLFGWFGGNGLDATADGFEALGPGATRSQQAWPRAGGGALLAAGLATPVAASVLTATMLTAIDSVHGKNGPWLSKGGYEYNVVLIAAAIALVEVGPGGMSLDAARGRERSGSTWALAALAAGTLGAVGVRLASAPQRVPPDTSTEDADAAGQNGHGA